MAVGSLDTPFVYHAVIRLYLVKVRQSDLLLWYKA